MKNLNKIKLLHMRSDIQSALKQFNGMISGNGGRGLVKWLLKIISVARGGNTAALARSAVVATRLFYRLWKHGGMKFLVLYTKNAYILLMQSQATSRRADNARLLGAVVGQDRSGIPSVIPKVHRIAIRQGDRRLLRIWLSWFSVYRVLTFPSALKLTTITDPGVSLDPVIPLLGPAVMQFITNVLKLQPGKIQLPNPEFISLTKSTPSVLWGKDRVSGSPLGIAAAAAGLMNSEVFHSFKRFIEFFPESKIRVKDFRKTWEEMEAAVPNSNLRLPIGKLGFKREAAGKVRVFAMVDCWTQWVLQPLHKIIFSWLSKLPMDGTFDQLAPVNRLVEAGKTRFWCYDLSAATDRLPVLLQSVILNLIFKSDLGNVWATLLVSRDYHLPTGLPPGVMYEAGDLPRTVRYSVGQPMGALSSWAMLALTHHFIVHWAASYAGFSWGSFRDYAVLGDDIVIADGRVAGEYLRLMKLIGVGIGVHKSLISRRGILEFAKRYLVQGVDCSPIPFKEMVAAIHDFESSTTFVQKYNLSARSAAVLLGLGYRVRGSLAGTFNTINRRLATLGIWRYSPWGDSPKNFASWFLINSWVLRPEWLVQTTEMWPELTGKAAEQFIKMGIKDSRRVESLQLLHPSSNAGKKWSIQWMQDILYKMAMAFQHPMKFHVGKKITNVPPLVRFAPKFYNVLYYIQELAWSMSMPVLKSEISQYGDVISKVKLAASNNRIPDHVALALVKARTEFSLLGPRKIGEKRKVKETPSLLFAVKLWRGYKDIPVKRKSKSSVLTVPKKD